MNCHTQPLSSAATYHINRLEVLQHRALKIILQVEHRTNSRQVFEIIQAAPISNLHKLQILVVVNKHVNSLFCLSSVNTTHIDETRTGDFLKIPNARELHLIVYLSGPIPVEQPTLTINLFKIRLKCYLLI